MKLKEEKGFTGADIAVAVIIILIFMSTIGTVFYNITLSSRAIERKTEATYIAVNVIEEIKAIDYDNATVGSYTDTDLATIINGYTSTTGYSVGVQIENYYPEGESLDLVKTVKVTVQYKVGKNIENVELNTTLTRES